MKKIIAVFTACLLIITSAFCAGASSGKIYYLFGYINGANYACEEDYENMGEYRFENGKLTARFDKVSYVAVKEVDNANWYMTDGWMGEVHSVTLLNTTITRENSNKLKVPEGVDVNFTLSENSDGTLTLSYEAVNEGYPIRAQLWDYVNIEIEQNIMVPGNYWTEESEAVFLKALKEAKEVLDNKDASDKQLVTAYDNLKKAEAGLKCQDAEYWRKKLAALTAEYSMAFEDIDYQYTVYTKDSFDKYYAAYKKADKALLEDELSLNDLSGFYYGLINARESLVRLDGVIVKPDKEYYKTDEFKTILGLYGKEIGIGSDVMDNSGDAVVRTLDGKEVTEYRGLRIFKSRADIMVFGLSDMLCTVGEEVIDGYKFSNPIFEGGEKNKTGLCVYYNGKIFSIKDAVKEGITTAEELAGIIPYTEKGGTLPTIPVIPATTSVTTPAIPLPTEKVESMPIVINRPTDNTENYPDEQGQYLVQGGTTQPVTEKQEQTEGEKPSSSSADKPTESVPTEATEPSTVNPVETFSTEATEPVTDNPEVSISTQPTEPDKTEPESKTSETETSATAEPESTSAEVEKPTESNDKKPEKEEPAPIKTKKSNTIKVTVKSIRVKAKKLKKANCSIKAFTVKNAEGELSVVKVKNGTSAKIFKKIIVNGKAGTIRFKKGKYSKKTYSVKLKITAEGNDDYKAKTVIKAVKIRIK